MEELGSGFYLAMHDLEIRGAGEVLGENQSGNMMEVGFQLYNDMLGRGGALAEGRPRARPAVAAVAPPPRSTCTRPALLPDDYCGDVHTRLSSTSAWPRPRSPSRSTRCSKRSPTASASCPPQGQTLFDVHRLRVLAKPYGVVKIDAAPKLMVISFRPNPPVDAMQDHRAGAEEPPHQAGRQRQAAHRARDARAQGPRAAHARRAALAGHAEDGRRRALTIL